MNKTLGEDAAFATPDVQGPNQMQQGNPGLSKREYFAACALQGHLANGREPLQQPAHFSIANASVLFADALIQALNQP